MENLRKNIVKNKNVVISSVIIVTVVIIVSFLLIPSTTNVIDTGCKPRYFSRDITGSQQPATDLGWVKSTGSLTGLFFSNTSSGLTSMTVSAPYTAGDTLIANNKMEYTRDLGCSSSNINIDTTGQWISGGWRSLTTDSFLGFIFKDSFNSVVFTFYLTNDGGNISFHSTDNIGTDRGISIYGLGAYAQRFVITFSNKNVTIISYGNPSGVGASYIPKTTTSFLVSSPSIRSIDFYMARFEITMNMNVKFY